MAKKSSRIRRTIDRSATTDIVTQLVVAFRNPQAALIGALIGGLVPWFGRTLAHGEIQDAWSGNRPLALAMVVVVLGCGAFSGLSVYKFGMAAFGDERKALGFVLALEGVMLVSHGVTSAVALLVLILINAVANGSVIALARDATRRRQDADAKRASSRRRPTSTPAEVPAPSAPTIPAPRREHKPASAPTYWSPAMADDVIDARIVRETRLLA